MGEEKNAIHRYTDLPALLYLLAHGCITLLNPENWDDANDSHFLQTYKQANGLTCLNALCLSEADETYHHWRVFASGASGIRITFLKNLLIHTLADNEGIRHAPVMYKKIADVRLGPKPSLSELPFLKRYPYEQECEYRFIYESRSEPQMPTDLKFPLRCIRRITLSPWMAKPVSDAVKQALRSMPGCGNVSVGRSTLIGNEDWMKYGDSSVMLDGKRAGRKAEKEV